MLYPATIKRQLTLAGRLTPKLPPYRLTFVSSLGDSICHLSSISAGDARNGFFYSARIEKLPAALGSSIIDRTRQPAGSTLPQIQSTPHSVGWRRVHRSHRPPIAHPSVSG